MADIVNLRQARKTRKRMKERVQADENAVKYGRAKSEKRLTEAQAEKAARDLDGHKREP